jgi:hypothetical protein
MLDRGTRQIPLYWNGPYLFDYDEMIDFENKLAKKEKTGVANTSFREAGVYGITVEKTGLLTFLTLQAVYIPLYVGKSDNLGKRINSHLPDKTKNACLLSHYKGNEIQFWYALAHPDDLDDIESQLIRHFRPRCNSHHPPELPGYKVEITVPQLWERNS